MTRPIHKLSARTVATLKKIGRQSDGGGLYLFISKDRRRWVFRFVKDGGTREMGLGSATSISLSEARRKAADARHAVKAGTMTLSSSETPPARLRRAKRLVKLPRLFSRQNRRSGAMPSIALNGK
jgi:Arm domain-containing DNA-binding protein